MNHKLNRNIKYNKNTKSDLITENSDVEIADERLAELRKGETEIIHADVVWKELKIN